MASKSPQAISFNITTEGVQNAQAFFERENSSQPFTLTFNSTGDNSLKNLSNNIDAMLAALATSSIRVQTIKYSQPPGRCSRLDLGMFSLSLPQFLPDFESGPIEIHVENVDLQQLYYASNPVFNKHIRVIKLLLPYRLPRIFWSLPVIEDVLSGASDLQQLLITTDRTLGSDEDTMLDQIRQRGVDVEVEWADGSRP